MDNHGTWQLREKSHVRLWTHRKYLLVEFFLISLRLYLKQNIPPLDCCVVPQMSKKEEEQKAVTRTESRDMIQLEPPGKECRREEEERRGGEEPVNKKRDFQEDVQRERRREGGRKEVAAKARPRLCGPLSEIACVWWNGDVSAASAPFAAQLGCHGDQHISLSPSL